MVSQLGDCSVSSLVKWEHGINPVPEWVAKEMLRQVILPLPFEVLGELVALAQAQSVSFDVMMVDAIREYIAQRQPAPTIEILKVADDAARYKSDGTTN
jgi:hypothetical protein